MERRTRSYLQLIKPGITLSNTLTAVAGAFLGSSVVGFALGAFVGGIVGTALVIASACVINNVLDRDIDTRMKRTSKREVASGNISIRNALFFALILGVLGFASLSLLTNTLTFLLGAIAFVWYVVIYGYAKRTTAFSTLIGGVPGALPPVAGYAALVGTLDFAALVLFLILFLWQLPHFYAISLFRKADYAKAGLPVWAVRYGEQSTRAQVLVSIIAFAAVVPLLTVLGYAGWFYLLGSLLLAGWWLYVVLSTYRTKDAAVWSRKVFGVSLAVLLGMIGLISLGGFLI